MVLLSSKSMEKNTLLTENTTATIEYLGNDYYNPSNTTIEITVTAPEEPAEETSDDPEEPAEEPEEDFSIIDISFNCLFRK